MKTSLWMRAGLLALIPISLFISGCGPASTPTASTFSPGPTSTPLPSTPGLSPTERPAARLIRVWLPPQFDPSSGTPAGNLLKARLDEFVAAHPGLVVEVRDKAESGPAGLLESLRTTSEAAPSAMPDLIALPYRDMESAATRGLIHPLDNLTGVLAGADWYDYAHQLAQIQNMTFGLPFAGDALVLVYRPSAAGDLEPNWDSIQTSQIVIAFPAADPQALVTLALYQSAGGSLVDSQNRPALDPQILAEVLTLYKNGAFSNSATQFTTDDQAWQAFRAGRVDAVITWASSYLREAPNDSAALPLPGLQGLPYSLADGWIWAVAAPDAGQQASAVALAEYLVESRFAGAWTSALGYSPSRPSALAAWKDEKSKILAGNVATSAQLIPPVQVTSILGPLLKQAVLQVLNGQASPNEAAQAAVAKLK